MPRLANVTYQENELLHVATAKGRVAVTITLDGKLSGHARRVNKLMRGVLARMVETSGFGDHKPGDVVSFPFPSGLEAIGVDVILLPNRPQVADLRRAGANLSKVKQRSELLLCLGNVKKSHELILSMILRDYRFDTHKTDAKKDPFGDITVQHNEVEGENARCQEALLVAEGVYVARDLTFEPGNVLNPTSYAAKIEKLSELGLEIRVLGDSEMEDLGMGSFLSVGLGSAQPCKLAVMSWQGGEKDAAPLALVGKGVTFDTGGISIKPSGSMEEMTMDMGGSAVVVGTMVSLAKRKVKANVVGLVGLVENMPSGTATRPGDVVTSMKGDTIEIINTDAEGRLVLADVLWYAQETYAPSAIIDFATLTGAVIISLGHENAGVFSNNTEFCNKFIGATQKMDEGAWRLPLSPAYDQQLKSKIADMKNVGTRAGGSITAAQFLQRFVKEDTPWIHVDIAGVAMTKSDTTWSNAGITGWGVLSLNQLIDDHYLPQAVAPQAVEPQANDNAE